MQLFNHWRWQKLFWSLVFTSSISQANVFNDPYTIPSIPSNDEIVPVGSDYIELDDAARRALEENEPSEHAIALKGLYAAFDSPIKAQNEGSYEHANIGEFTFQISAGYGIIENPLKQRQDIDVYVLPEFSYYGEKFFIENFVAGYSLFESEQLMFDVFGYFNDDGYFFELDGIEKITVSTILGLAPNKTPIVFGSVPELKAVERDLSYMGGFNTTYRGDWLDIQLSLATDVTDVHNGQEAKLKFSKKMVFGDWLLSASIENIFKSSEINDYYYRIQKGEIYGRIPTDSLGSSFTRKTEILIAYKITPHLSANLLLQKTELDDKLENSYLIEDLSYLSGFAGLRYRF